MNGEETPERNRLEAKIATVLPSGGSDDLAACTIKLDGINETRHSATSLGGWMGLRRPRHGSFVSGRKRHRRMSGRMGRKKPTSDRKAPRISGKGVVGNVQVQQGKAHSSLQAAIPQLMFWTTVPQILFMETTQGARKSAPTPCLVLAARTLGAGPTTCMSYAMYCWAAREHQASVDVYCCQSYQGTRTYDGVDVCADRVVVEVRGLFLDSAVDVTV